MNRGHPYFYSISRYLKELCNSLCILHSSAYMYVFQELWSFCNPAELNFSILNHPCSFIVYYHLFCVFFS